MRKVVFSHLSITWFFLVTCIAVCTQVNAQSNNGVIEHSERVVRDHRDVEDSQTVVVGTRVWIQPAAIGPIDWDSLDDQFDRTTGRCKVSDCRISNIDLNAYIWASKEDVDQMLRAFGLRGFEGDYRICTGCWASEPPNSMDVVFERFTFTRQWWTGDYINALTRNGSPPDRCDDSEVSITEDGTEVSTGCTAIPGQKYGVVIELHRATGAELETQRERDHWNGSPDKSSVMYGPRSHGAWLYKNSMRVQAPPSGPLCENSSIQTCSTHGAKCIIVSGVDGLTTDVCKWHTQNSLTRCKTTPGIWTTPESTYAIKHPGIITPGTLGTCASEVRNLKNLKSGRHLIRSRYQGNSPVIEN